MSIYNSYHFHQHHISKFLKLLVMCFSLLKARSTYITMNDAFSFISRYKYKILNMIYNIIELFYGMDCLSFYLFIQVKRATYGAISTTNTHTTTLLSDTIKIPVIGYSNGIP